MDAVATGQAQNPTHSRGHLKACYITVQQGIWQQSSRNMSTSHEIPSTSMKFQNEEEINTTTNRNYPSHSLTTQTIC